MVIYLFCVETLPHQDVLNLELVCGDLVHFKLLQTVSRDKSHGANSLHAAQQPLTKDPITRGPEVAGLRASDSLYEVPARFGTSYRDCVTHPWWLKRPATQ